MAFTPALKFHITYKLSRRELILAGRRPCLVWYLMQSYLQYSLSCGRTKQKATALSSVTTTDIIMRKGNVIFYYFIYSSSALLPLLARSLTFQT